MRLCRDLLPLCAPGSCIQGPPKPQAGRCRCHKSLHRGQPIRKRRLGRLPAHCPPPPERQLGRLQESAGGQAALRQQSQHAIYPASVSRHAGWPGRARVRPSSAALRLRSCTEPMSPTRAAPSPAGRPVPCHPLGAHSCRPTLATTSAAARPGWPKQRRRSEAANLTTTPPRPGHSPGQHNGRPSPPPTRPAGAQGNPSSGPKTTFGDTHPRVVPETVPRASQKIAKLG